MDKKPHVWTSIKLNTSANNNSTEHNANTVGKHLPISQIGVGLFIIDLVVVILYSLIKLYQKVSANDGELKVNIFFCF